MENVIYGVITNYELDNNEFYTTILENKIGI